VTAAPFGARRQSARSRPRYRALRLAFTPGRSPVRVQSRPPDSFINFAIPAAVQSRDLPPFGWVRVTRGHARGAVPGDRHHGVVGHRRRREVSTLGGAASNGRHCALLSLRKSDGTQDSRLGIPLKGRGRAATIPHSMSKTSGCPKCTETGTGRLRIEHVIQGGKSYRAVHCDACGHNWNVLETGEHVPSSDRPDRSRTSPLGEDTSKPEKPGI